MRSTRWNLDHEDVSSDSSLKGGFIPEGTECPFAYECDTKAAGKCWHSGSSHPVPYQCATANLIHLKSKYKKAG